MMHKSGMAVRSAAGTALALMLSSAPVPAQAGTEPFVGDILAVGENNCPRGWTEAAGQLLQISQNTALFSLYGTTYGGDGRITFGLPDLRGRVAMGQGNGPGLTPRVPGEKFGAEDRAITVAQMPAHSHAVNANNLDGDKPGPGDKLLAAAPTGGTGNETIYSNQPANKTMNPVMIAPTGGGQPINTEDPFLVMRYCVALQGVFPPRN